MSITTRNCLAPFVGERLTFEAVYDRAGRTKGYINHCFVKLMCDAGEIDHAWVADHPDFAAYYLRRNDRVQFTAEVTTYPKWNGEEFEPAYGLRTIQDVRLLS